MKKRRISLILCTVALVFCIAFAANVSSSAASNVVNSDWITSPQNTLVKCPGGECDHSGCDYAYSFAIVGDTQSLNIRDVVYGDENMSVLYQWLVDNKAKYKIEYVMGVGDITESFNESYVINRPGVFEYPNGPYSTYAAEWENAKDAVALLDGNIPYSLVIGNHDNSTGLNATFGVGSTYYEALLAQSKIEDGVDSLGNPRYMAGFFDVNKIEDTYRKVEFAGHKYIIFTLQRYPAKNADVVKWIGDTLEANSDYSAVITLHQFMYKDATILDAVDKDESLERSYERVLWEDCLSKYLNVSMIISGHVECDDIYKTQLRGDNGNTVTCMLVDGQEIDMVVEPAGMIAMLYFSADGKVVNVEYISSVRDTDNKINGTSNPIYLKDKNQFSLTLDYTTESGDGWKKTPYGYILESVYNNEEYTFHVILDDDANENTTPFYYGSYATWEETLSAMHAMNDKLSLEIREAKNYYIVMSQNYTLEGDDDNNAGKNPSNVILDLNGNSFTVDGGRMLRLYNKNKSLTPEFTIKNSDANGCINLLGSARICATLTEPNGSEGNVILNLEDLRINYGSGANGAIITNSNGDGTNGYVTVNMINCNIDSSATSSKVTYFKLNDTDNDNHVSLNITGGSFKGNTVSTTPLFTANEGYDKITFLKDENGNYTSLTLTDKGTVGGIFNSETDGVYLSYGDGVETDGSYVYSLKSASVEKTPYGYIDNEAYPVSSNPFAFFSGNEKDGYAFEGAGKLSKYTSNYSKYSGKIAYLRQDNYTLTAKINPTYIDGEFTVDLGGKTIIRNSVYMFDFVADNDSGLYSTSLIIKNGTMESTSNYFIALNNTAMTTRHKNVSMIFDGITFKYTSSSANASGAFFNCWKSKADTTEEDRFGINAKLTYNDCIFDFTNTPKSAIMLKFKGGDSTNESDVIATFNGGTIITADANAGWRLFESNVSEAHNSKKDESGNYTDIANAVYLNNGSDGRPIKLVVTSDSVGKQPKVAHYYEASDGSYYFVAESDNSTSGATAYTYRLTKIRPFEVFDSSSLSKGKFGLWSEAFAKALSTGEGATIRLYSDASVLDAGAGSGINCTINVDLNGHSLSKITGKYIIDTYFANTTEQKAKVIFSEGTIIKTKTSNKYGLFNINYSASTTVDSEGQKPNSALATLDYEFKNVTFINERTDDYIFSLFEKGFNNDWTKGTLTNAVFNNCIFNYKSTVFNTDHSTGADKTIINVTVNGGIFVYSGNSTPKSICSMDSKDSFAFGKDDKGYTTFTLPKNLTSDDFNNTFITADGVECVFVKASETDGNANYTLYPEVMVGYKIKTSVTLYSNFVYNIYIPKANVARFNVNGITKANEEIEIDGVLYYLVKVELPAPESLSDIAVCVTLNSGDTTVDANWTLSVLKYAKSVIGGGYDDTTKNLMRDMLVYASAAHTYFENELDDAKVNTITDLLDGYKRDLPTGDAKAPADKTYFTSATVYLGEVPSFRFYLAEGYTADDFSFKVGQRSVTATIGEDKYGNYLEVVMYAYMMLDDVTYTVTDKLTKESVTESYNLYSYYRSADEANKNLIALVEGLMKYSVSAAAYRASVVEN